jgi:O-succinylbenzoate synthase
MMAESQPRGGLEQEKTGKLDRVELVLVRIPFVIPFKTSVFTWSCKEALLMRVESEGVTAWSECVADPDPYYFHETITTCRHIIKDFLLPLVEPGITFAEIARRFRRVRGHGMAKAALENALIILAANRNGIPLHEQLGWPARPVMSGISIGLKETPGELVDAVAGAVARKYGRIKIKIRKGKDVEMVAAVRERFPEIRLMVDANGDYTLADAARLRELDRFNLMMIEQPFGHDDIYEHSLLQKELSTAICLDESIHSFDDAVAAVAFGACCVINIKQGRVGGLMEAMRIARHCAGHGIGAWSGGMDETGIGRAVNIHLQADPGFTLPGDTSETLNYFREDIADPPVVLNSDGTVPVPPGPGTGVTVVLERLMKAVIGWERLI